MRGAFETIKKNAKLMYKKRGKGTFLQSFGNLRGINL